MGSSGRNLTELTMAQPTTETDHIRFELNRIAGVWPLDSWPCPYQQQLNDKLKNRVEQATTACCLCVTDQTSGKITHKANLGGIYVI